MLYLTAFVSGFVLMCLEIFGSRVLTPYFGGGTRVWGALLAVFMAGLGTGYALGGITADRRPGLRTLGMLLLLCGLVLAMFPLYARAICGISEILWMSQSFQMLSVSMLLFFAPSTLIGMLMPCIVKLNTNSLNVVGRGSGNIYALGTAGSIAGTLASAFYLVGLMPSTMAVSCSGALLLCNAAVCFAASRIQIVVPRR
ncbi:MAG: fused MFS/spermidine synthase [Victivallales bacterium]|nr:fused MFS/spermidine synthase [Victivallales bacterium]